MGAAVTAEQRDRALVLDLFAKWNANGTSACEWHHPATGMSNDEVDAVMDAMIADGLLRADYMIYPCSEWLTPAGLAAHASAQRTPTP